MIRFGACHLSLFVGSYRKLRDIFGSLYLSRQNCCLELFVTLKSDSCMNISCCLSKLFICKTPMLVCRMKAITKKLLFPAEIK